MITSINNPRVKDAVRLRERRERSKQRLFGVEGAREISHALAGRFVPHHGFFCEESLTPESRALLSIIESSSRARLEAVSLPVFARMAVRESSDGLWTAFESVNRRLDELVASELDLVLVLENVEKPGNLGALMRTADGVGATVVVLGQGVDPFGPNTIRASLGAVFRVPLVITSSKEFRDFCHCKGIAIVACSPAGSRLYHQVDLGGPVAILIGSEAHGLTREWIDCAKWDVSIPMSGAVDSLNASIAGAILLYEAVRQRSVGRP